LIGEDLSKISNIEELVKYKKFDVISHQAANVGVGESQYEIKKYVDNNIGFTGELLQALLKNRKMMPPRIILAGSMGPYGEGPFYCAEHHIVYPKRLNIRKPNCPICNGEIHPMSINENAERIPKSIYGLTKMAQEDMVRIFSDVYGVDVISLRYFSVYGENSNPNNPYTGVLSIIANKILNSDVVKLYEDGSQTRDLISAIDVADAHWHVSNLPIGNKFDAFNVGTGHSVNIEYVARKMVDIMSPGKTIEFTNEYRSGDIKYSCADISKLTNATNWQPTHTIDESITRYCSYVMKHECNFNLNGDSSNDEHINLKKMGVI
jgi:dTDP-L-rhamnose 4-epimerase